MVTPIKIKDPCGNGNRKEGEPGLSNHNGSSWLERLKEKARLERIRGYRARLNSLLLKFPESPEDASSLTLEILEALFRKIGDTVGFYHEGAVVDGIRLGDNSLPILIQGKESTGKLVLLFSADRKHRGFYLCEKLIPYRNPAGKQECMATGVLKKHRQIFMEATDEEKKTLINMAASAIFKELGLEWSDPVSQP